MSNFIEFLKIVVFGVVEGFTEWLPISSTGHLILVENIVHLNVSEEFMNVFRVVIQLGAILAVLVLYFRRLNPFDPGKKPAQKRATWHLWFKIIIACLPAAVVGILLDEVLDKYLYNPYVVAAMLIICLREPQPARGIPHKESIPDQLPDRILHRSLPAPRADPGYIEIRRNDPRCDDAWLFQNRRIGVHLLPWNSGHVRRQPLKDPSLRPGILRNGALLHGSCHGDRLRRFHVLDPVLTRICQKT